MNGKVSIRFLLNNEEVAEKLPPGTLVLDYLRRIRGLTGTKEGCREGDCGACTVLLGTLQGDEVRYKAVPSCMLLLGSVAGKHLVTIEGLTTADPTPVQRAIVDEGASQCGFCTPGVVLSLTGFLLDAEAPQPEQAVSALDGNICRCTGYAAIKRAARRAAAEAQALLQRPEALNNGRLAALVRGGYLPAYFLEIPQRLRDLQEKVSLAGLHPAALPVAGGTDLLVQKPEELLQKPLRFLEQESDLTGVRCEEGTCVIGAATTVAELQGSSDLARPVPELPEYLGLFASTLVRNRATVGGNLVNASPIGDLSVMLLALGAEVLLSSGRTVPLERFFLAYKKLDLRQGEIVRAVRFKVPDAPYTFHFEKISKRRHLDIASVNSAALVKLDRQNKVALCRISAGGVAPVPLLLKKASEFLLRAGLSEQAILQAAALATTEVSPITDVRGSAEYKRLLLRQLVVAHFVPTGLAEIEPHALFASSNPNLTAQ